MSDTIELPAVLDLSLALKFIPVVELQENFGNFEQWEHSVRFYLRYHGLLTHIGEDSDRQTGRFSNPHYDLQHRLFVYSLIWKSAAAVFRPSQLRKDLQNELYQNREHDPKQLWKILHDRRGSVRNLQRLDLGYSD